MAYVLGYWYADGNVLDATKSTRGKYSSVTSTDRETVFNFKSLLDSRHKISESFRAIHVNSRRQYTLRIGSRELYDSLLDKGLRPNKSLIMTFPKIPSRFLADFVRGYFDGDGCVHIEKSRGKNKQIILKRLRTIFTSGSKKFLASLRIKLEKNTGLIDGLLTFSHRSFQLIYPTSESVKLFKFLYKNVGEPLFLKRKLLIFLDYFEMRPQRVDNEVAGIIRCFKRPRGEVV